MNFDFWKEELSIYPDECTSVDEQEVLIPEEEAEGQQMYRVVPKEK